MSADSLKELPPESGNHTDSGDFSVHGDPLPEHLLTVAICTYNRPVELERCLASLVADTGSRQVSILVIDNCPSQPSVAAVVAQFQDRLAVQRVEQPVPGLSNARNKALEHCKTPYLIYLDDDAIVEPPWFDVAVAIIRGHHPDLFGGPYIPYYATQPPSWFQDKYGSALTDLSEGVVPPSRHLSGGNLGVRVEPVCQLGGFPTDLGMVAGTIGLGEETWLQNQLRTRHPDTVLWFSPDLRIRHLVAPYKYSVWYWVRRSWRAGEQWEQTSAPISRGNSSLGSAPAPNDGTEGWPTNRAVRLVLHIIDTARLLLGAFWRNRKQWPTWQQYTVEVIAPKAHFWGMFFRFLRDALRGR